MADITELKIKETEHFAIYFDSETGVYSMIEKEIPDGVYTGTNLENVIETYVATIEDWLIGNTMSLIEAERLIAEIEEEVGLKNKKQVIKNLRVASTKFENDLHNVVLELDAYSPIANKRKTTTITYPEDEAIAWCIDNLPDAIRMTLLVSVFEKEAKKLAEAGKPLPFVVITEEESTAIARKALQELAEEKIKNRTDELGF